MGFLAAIPQMATGLEKKMDGRLPFWKSSRYFNTSMICLQKYTLQVQPFDAVCLQIVIRADCGSKGHRLENVVSAAVALSLAARLIAHAMQGLPLIDFLVTTASLPKTNNANSVTVYLVLLSQV